MRKSRRWLLIPFVIAVIVIVGFISLSRPSALHEDLSFLMQLDETPETKTSLFYSLPDGLKAAVGGNEELQFDIAEPIVKVNERIKAELDAKGWTREWRSTGNKVTYSKELPGNAGKIWIKSMSGGGTWTSVMVRDSRRRLPKWRVWLHNLLN